MGSFLLPGERIVNAPDLAKKSVFTTTQNPTSEESKAEMSTWVSYGGNVLWLPVLALTGFGILFVYSASSVYSAQYYGNEFYFVKKQALFLIPSMFAAVLGAKIPFEFFYKWIKPVFILLILMTFLTHLPTIGKRVGGAARWLNLGPISIQPAEFLKVLAILFMVSTIATRPIKRSSLILLCLAPIAVLLQKDLGTTLVILCAYMSVLFMNGLAKRYMVAIFSFLSFGLALAIMVEPYRISRVMTFLNPFKDPLGAGFQVIQSFVAVANGGFFGRGIGESQQKLFFLPEAHTDFILAVITEEMGFVGVLVLAILYSVLYYAILRLILHARTNSERLLATGTFAILVLTTIVNMGAVAGALPTKGLPLPFISNGGCAIIANYFLIGLMSQISRRAHS